MSHPLSKKQLEVLKALEQFARTRGHIPSVRELATRLKKSPTTVFQHLKALERRGYLESDGSAHGWRQLVTSAPPVLPPSTPPPVLRRTLTPGAGGVAAQAEPDREADNGDAARSLSVVAEECDVSSEAIPETGRGWRARASKVEPERAMLPEGWVRVRIAGSIAAGAPIEAVEDSTESRLFPADMVPEGAFALRVRGSSMIEDHICDGDLVVVRPQQEVHDGEIAVALLEDGSATLKRVFRESGRVRLQPANATMAPIYAENVTIQGRVVGVWRHCD